jgi:hypothetical protein
MASRRYRPERRRRMTRPAGCLLLVLLLAVVLLVLSLLFGGYQTGTRSDQPPGGYSASVMNVLYGVSG